MHAASRPLAQRILGTLALGLLALAAWLAWPRPAPPPARAGLRAVLLDASAGTTRLRPGWGRWARRALADEAEAARAEGRELLVVRFAADVERLFGPGDPAEFLALLAGRRAAPPQLALAGAAAQGTRLAEALELAARDLVDPGRASGAWVLLGEPAYTGPDPGSALSELARAGVTGRIEAPPPAELANVALTGLELARAPAAGEPLVARASLALSAGSRSVAELLGAAELRLELELRTPSGVRRLDLHLAPPAIPSATREVSWSLAVDLGPAEPGWVEALGRARLVGPGGLRAGDPIPEDDRRSAATRVAGKRVGLALAGPGERGALEAWLGADPWPGIAWILLEPRELVGRLSDADLVLTLDVPLAELPEPWLRDFVERRGGGLLVSGGWGMLRQWTGTRGDPPLAELLPLVPAGADEEPREVLFVVDGSGSMIGEPFELVKRALVELVEVASPRDALALRFFTGTLHEPLELSGSTPLARRQAVERLLRLGAPGGGTAILYSLEQLVRARAEARAPGLVVLLSDGLDRGAHDVPERSAAIRAGLAASRTQLSVVAAGEAADLELLRELAGAERAFHHARDLADLAEIFQREVNRERVREGELAVRPVDPGSVELLPAREVLEALARLPAEALPDLERHARVELAHQATALLVSERGEPVLAVQRVGAGLVAAFASAPVEGWAPAWGRAHSALGALALALASGPREPRPGARFADGRVELLDVPPGWPPRLEARLEDEAGRLLARRELVLPPGAPGEDPRGRRVDPLEPLDGLPWGRTLRLVVLDGGRELASLPVALPAAEEWAGKRPLGPLPPPRAGVDEGVEGLGAAPDPRHVPPLAAALAALFVVGLLAVLGPRGGRVPPPAGTAGLAAGTAAAAGAGGGAADAAAGVAAGVAAGGVAGGAASAGGPAAGARGA